MKALEEGMELLATWLKLIKITDRSEYRWKVVTEYKADELAPCSEDKKKIERVERTAERKALKKGRAMAKSGSRKFSGKLHQTPGGRQLHHGTGTHHHNGCKSGQRARPHWLDQFQ